MFFWLFTANCMRTTFFHEMRDENSLSRIDHSTVLIFSLVRPTLSTKSCHFLNLLPRYDFWHITAIFVKKLRFAINFSMKIDLYWWSRVRSWRCLSKTRFREPERSENSFHYISDTLLFTFDYKLYEKRRFFITFQTKIVDEFLVDWPQDNSDSFPDKVECRAELKPKIMPISIAHAIDKMAGRGRPSFSDGRRGKIVYTSKNSLSFLD